MKVLVTGGAGFIGSFIVDELVRRGHEVIIFDSLDPQVHPDGRPPEYLNKNAMFVQGDVRNRDALFKALGKCEVVFHEAGAVGVGQSQYEIARFVDVNIGGTAVLTDILANEKHNVGKLIVAASKSSYGEGNYRCDKCGVVRPRLRSPEDVAPGRWEPPCPICRGSVKAVPTDEDAVQFASSVYSYTKKGQEDLALLVGRTYALPTVALRYFNVYGPRQSLSNPYTGVAAIFMSRLKNERQPVLYEDGLQTLDFVSVHDVVQANMHAMEYAEPTAEVFNVGCATPVSVIQLAETLARLYGKDIGPLVTNRFRKGDIRHCYSDNTKIAEKLGFKPGVSFEQGMKELIEWSDTANAVDGFEDAERELTQRGLV